MQYKTVPGPYDLRISRREDCMTAIRQFAYIIDQEAAGGWQLNCIHTISVSKRKGCITNETETQYFNMLVFQKEGVTNMPVNGGMNVMGNMPNTNYPNVQ